MNDFLNVVLALIVAAVTVVIVALVIGLPVKWLWNSTMPDLFGLKVITFWQAVRLTILAGFLTRGTGSSEKA